jgi:predicted dehydrogenase
MAEKSFSTQSLATQTESTYSGRTLRVAFIGCGGVTNFHMPSLKLIPEVEVVAGCDIDPNRLKAFGEKWGVTKLYSDWNQMLKEVQPDIANVCTPNGLHMAPSVDASNAGCHVFVEKPMAMTPAECQRMIDAAKKADRKLSAGFQYRYHPTTQYLARARDAGQFGKVLFVKCRALRRRGIPNWGVFGRKELQGGGPMIDIGVHVIEMAHYVMGSPKPVAATGNTWTYLGNRPSDVVSRWPNWDHQTYNVEDLAVGHVRFEGGAVMQIEASFAAHVEQDVWNFSLAGEKGGANWDPAMVFTDRHGTMVNETPAFLPEGGFQELFTLKLRQFVHAVLNDTPLEAPGEAGLAVQKILDGVYRSAAGGGREVAID